MRIPFDSLVLHTSLNELRLLMGARAQKWLAVNEHTVAVELYLQGVQWLWFSFHPEFFRIHVGPKPDSKIDPTPFLLDLRKYLNDSRLSSVNQVGLDRIAHLTFLTEEGELTLILELMGKHSNVMLVDKNKRLMAAAKWLGLGKTIRPILPGQRYSPPPHDPKPSLLKAASSDPLQDFQGVSPFLRKLVDAGVPLNDVQRAFQSSNISAHCASEGVYPISVDPLIEQSVSATSIGQALHDHYNTQESTYEIQHLRSWLKAQLDRVQLAREVAIRDLEEAADTARRARQLQLEGELIIAYASQIEGSQSNLQAWDYEGNPLEIKLNCELSPLENAERRFKRAKRAKAAAQGVGEQLRRFQDDLADIVSTQSLVALADTLPELERLKQESASRRWLNRPAPAKEKADRPFEGHRITELLGPKGYRVLIGENSEANDYLTLRVAKPDDWWLHVRGSASAHAIVPTSKQPDRVPPDVLEFAALAVVKKSPMKHSSHVPVDLTLKKYVRRIKGAPKGTVQYSHERVLHVDP